METQDINILNPMILDNHLPFSVKTKSENKFQKILEDYDSPVFHTQIGNNNPFIPHEIPADATAHRTGRLMGKKVAAIYNQQDTQFVKQEKMSDWQKC